MFLSCPFSSSPNNERWKSIILIIWTDCYKPLFFSILSRSNSSKQSLLGFFITPKNHKIDLLPIRQTHVHSCAAYCILSGLKMHSTISLTISLPVDNMLTEKTRRDQWRILYEPKKPSWSPTGKTDCCCPSYLYLFHSGEFHSPTSNNNNGEDHVLPYSASAAPFLHFLYPSGQVIVACPSIVLLQTKKRFHRPYLYFFVSNHLPSSPCSLGCTSQPPTPMSQFLYF